MPEDKSACHAGQTGLDCRRNSRPPRVRDAAPQPGAPTTTPIAHTKSQAPKPSGLRATRHLLGPTYGEAGEAGAQHVRCAAQSSHSARGASATEGRRRLPLRPLAGRRPLCQPPHTPSPPAALPASTSRRRLCHHRGPPLPRAHLHAPPPPIRSPGGVDPTMEAELRAWPCCRETPAPGPGTALGARLLAGGAFAQGLRRLLDGAGPVLAEEHRVEPPVRRGGLKGELAQGVDLIGRVLLHLDGRLQAWRRPAPQSKPNPAPRQQRQLRGVFDFTMLCAREKKPAGSCHMRPMNSPTCGCGGRLTPECVRG